MIDVVDVEHVEHVFAGCDWDEMNVYTGLLCFFVLSLNVPIFCCVAFRAAPWPHLGGRGQAQQPEPRHHLYAGRGHSGDRHEPRRCSRGRHQDPTGVLTFLSNQFQDEPLATNCRHWDWLSCWTTKNSNLEPNACRKCLHFVYHRAMSQSHPLSRPSLVHRPSSIERRSLTIERPSNVAFFPMQGDGGVQLRRRRHRPRTQQ